MNDMPARSEGWRLPAGAEPILSLFGSDQAIDELRILGSRIGRRLRPRTLPAGSNVMVIGCPRDLDGLGAGLVQALEARGCNVFVGCHWFKGLMREGQTAMAHRLKQQYLDELPETLDAVISVQTFLLDVMATRSSLLWASDRLPAARPHVVSLFASTSAVAALPRTLSDLSGSVPKILFELSVEASENRSDMSARLSEAAGSWTVEDDIELLPELVRHRRERRRSLQIEPEPPTSAPSPSRRGG